MIPVLRFDLAQHTLEAGTVAVVYDDGAGTVSTIVCNWFGAGNAGLADPNSDSFIQSCANIYDQNWLMKGNVIIAPYSFKIIP